MAEGDLITVAEAAARTGYTERHIRRLLRQQKIPGKKLGRDWLLTLEAVENYRRTDPRPGAKPRPHPRQ
jgi:excisionase family DNA binding protein